MEPDIAKAVDLFDRAIKAKSPEEVASIRSDVHTLATMFRVPGFDVAQLK